MGGKNLELVYQKKNIRTHLPITSQIYEHPHIDQSLKIVRHIVDLRCLERSVAWVPVVACVITRVPRSVRFLLIFLRCAEIGIEVWVRRETNISVGDGVELERKGRAR